MKKLLILGPEDVRREYVAAARREHYEVIIGSGDHETRQSGSGEQRLLMSVSDRQAVYGAASGHSVSGILGLGNEEALSAAYAAQRLELPGISYAVAQLLHNSLRLRAFQEQQHFRVPVYRDISREMNVRGMQWPLCVRPADDHTLLGAELVYDTQQLHTAWDKARKRSTSGAVIAEEYPGRECNEGGNAGMFLMTDLVVRGGTLQPMLLSECILHRDDSDPVPIGCRYPARLSKSSRILLAGECARLVSLLQLQDAQIGLLAYMIPGRTPYILGMGPLLCAFRMPSLLSRLYGRDLVQDIVRMSVGDCPAAGIYKVPSEGTCMAYYIVRAYEDGILRHIRLDPELQRYVCSWEWRAPQFHQIYVDDMHGRELGRLILEFPDEGAMDHVMSRIGELVSVQMDHTTSKIIRYPYHLDRLR